MLLSRAKKAAMGERMLDESWQKRLADISDRCKERVTFATDAADMG